LQLSVRELFQRAAAGGGHSAPADQPSGANVRRLG
jgi:hypothetical protein